MLNIILFLRSIVWTSTLAALLVAISILLVLVSAQDFFPLAIVFSLAANVLATLSKGN